MRKEISFISFSMVANKYTFFEINKYKKKLFYFFFKRRLFYSQIWIHKQRKIKKKTMQKNPVLIAAVTSLAVLAIVILVNKQRVKSNKKNLFA